MRVGSSNNASIISLSSIEPSGLFGDVIKKSFGWYSFTAARMPSISSEKSARRGTSIQRAALNSASKEYMPKVGGQERMQSSDSRKTRMRRSSNSSAPEPAMRYSAGTPVNFSSDVRKARLSGSG